MNDTPQDAVEVLGAGRFLRLVRRGRWEFVERTKPVGAAFIGAVTTDGKLLVTEEFRVPVNAWVIGCPAGLVGDVQGAEAEQLAEAVARELREEVGYDAGSVQLMTAGPTSPGQNTEVIAIVLATDLRKIGAGGGEGGEQINLHEIPLTEIDAWLVEKERQGRLIDPKVYTVLYFIRFRATQ
jgi:ADP-ribose pyrophosphatase